MWCDFNCCRSRPIWRMRSSLQNVHCSQTFFWLHEPHWHCSWSVGVQSVVALESKCVPSSQQWSAITHVAYKSFIWFLLQTGYTASLYESCNIYTFQRDTQYGCTDCLLILRCQLYMFRTVTVHPQELLFRCCMCGLWYVLIRPAGTTFEEVLLVGMYMYCKKWYTDLPMSCMSLLH